MDNHYLKHAVNASVIATIKEEYVTGKVDRIKASFLLVMEGLKGHECVALFDVWDEELRDNIIKVIKSLYLTGQTDNLGTIINLIEIGTDRKDVIKLIEGWDEGGTSVLTDQAYTHI